MALLGYNGFDHVDDGFELLRWDAYSSDSNIEYASTHGYGGGWGIRLFTTATTYLQKNLGTTKSTFILGAYYKIGTLSDSNEFLSFNDGATNQVEIRARVDGSIAVYRDTTLIAQSALGLISANTWFNLGIKITFSQTVGQVTVKLGETVIINTAANLDTCNTANEYIDSFRLWSNGGDVFIDHLYWADTSGSGITDITQGLRITTLYPIANGVSAQFTPSAGSNYQTVDEAQLVGTTDYNDSTTIGHIDTFDMTTYAGSSTIKALQITGAVQNPDAGTVVMRTVLRSGTVPANTEGADFTASATIKGMSTLYETEPIDAVAWTTSSVNAAESGYKYQA